MSEYVTPPAFSAEYLLQACEVMESFCCCKVKVSISANMAGRELTPVFVSWHLQLRYLAQALTPTAAALRSKMTRLFSCMMMDE